MSTYFLDGAFVVAVATVSRFVLAVMVLRKANPEDLPEIVRWLGRWWRK